VNLIVYVLNVFGREFGIKTDITPAEQIKTIFGTHRALRDNSRDLFGFNLLSDKGSPRVSVQQQPTGPVREKASIRNTYDRVHGMSKVLRHNEVIIHVIVACGGARGEDNTSDEFKPPGGTEHVGVDIPVTTNNPGALQSAYRYGRLL
jgi:hypothetical protein